MKKEYNLRERAEIVDIAIDCAKSLSAQPLIDYFQSKEHVEKYPLGPVDGPPSGSAEASKNKIK